MPDDGSATPQWSDSQKRFLELLQEPENHQLSVSALWRKAGFANAGYWYRAIADPQFEVAIKALRVEHGCLGPNAKAKPKTSQWHDYHERLLELLQVEKNRQISPIELCQKAGLPNYGYWYRALEHPQFREAVQALNVPIKRNKPRSEPRQKPPWGKNHQRFLDLLQVEENRGLGILQLCQKAGFTSRRAWYRAIEHTQFRAAVEALGVDVNRLGFYFNDKAKKKLPQWTQTHQRFLDLLQVEENRQLNVVELCQKAGFTHLSSWYRAIKHPQLRSELEAWGVELERHGLYLKGQSKAQRAILNVLHQKANRHLPIVEICRKAGYSDDYWYKSLQSEDFARAVRALGVDVERRQYNENGWTELQQSLLDFLQTPANRELSLTEICQQAGYPNCTYWFRALKNPRFVAAVEALGIKIWRNGRNENGFTRAQQRFLDLLQETPKTTAGELCKKAGLTNTSSWTQVIRDSHFIQQVNTFGFEVIRRERSKDGTTFGQKDLLAMLQIEDYRDLPIKKICSLAGHSVQVWYAALKRQHLVAAIEALGVRIRRCGPDEDGWTLAQQRLLEVLQREENRQLSVHELCRQAGYSDLSRWYESLSSEQFLAVLQDWDVPIARQKPPYTPHIYITPTMHLEDDLNRDIWDLRTIKSNYRKHRAPAAYVLDFTWIKNPQLRQQVKQYMRLKLPKWEASTFSPHLHSLKNFLIHLPEDVHLGTISRAHIEHVLPIVLSQSTDVWAKQCLGNMKAMVDYIVRSKHWSGPKPVKDLIDRDDIPSPRNPLPRPIPPEVLDQLDPLLEMAICEIANGRQPPILEPMLWDAILILRRTGMRFSDLAHLEAPNDRNRGGCLKQDTQGDWWVYIRAEETKMKREHQIPTDPRDGTVTAIRRQSQRVQDIPDQFGRSYLFRTPTGILTYKAFRKALEKLAPQLSFVGAPYTISSHQFRHTIATDMIDKEVDVVTLKEFLGHASLMMTMRYVKIYQESLRAKYQAYRAREQQTSPLNPLSSQLLPFEIAAARPGEACSGWVAGQEGRLYRFDLPSGLAVCEQPAGLRLSCLFDGHCSTTCTKMRADRQHLSAWQARRAQLEKTAAALQGFPGYTWNLQQHERELKQAEKVIATIQAEGFWDGRVHNTERL